MESTQITIVEAVHLSTAQVAHIAHMLDIEYLVIKGVGATLQRARSPRPSADVDILMRYSDVEAFCTAMAERHWKRRPFDTDDIFPVHSKTLYHPEWPSDLDVHWRFPGFEAAPGEVFDLLWERRAKLEVATRPVFVPDRTSALLIQALHALRAPWQPTNEADLDYVSSQLSDSGWSEFVDLAHMTGALGPLTPLLKAHGADLGLGRLPAASEEWTTRLKNGTPGKTRLHALLAAKPSQWSGHLRRAILPSRDQLASKELSLATAGTFRLAFARLSRLLGFVKHVLTFAWQQFSGKDSKKRS